MPFLRYKNALRLFKSIFRIRFRCEDCNLKKHSPGHIECNNPVVIRISHIQHIIPEKEILRIFQVGTRLQVG